MKTPEKLIGKKVKGFKFDGNDDISWLESMSSFVGKKGYIEFYDGEDNCFGVRFSNNSFFYPADQIEAHLVEDEIPTFTNESTEYDLLQHIKFCLECKNESQAIRLIEKYAFEKQLINNYEIPTLSDGVMMLVSDNNLEYDKEEVFFKYNNKHYVRIGMSFEPYDYIKPLEPTKEKQLTAILGSSEKVSEIMELFNDKK